MDNTKKEKKNIKVSKKHHDLLKSYCDKNGLKMYKLVEKFIDTTCNLKKDIYGED